MHVRHRHAFLRNLDDEGYLEAFLVSAVVCILVVRSLLYVSGFPQVGGKGLHIAHVLWGGFLLVAGFTVVINYLDTVAHRVASVIAGAGFGLYLDEIGKFVTSDNNYFFRPASSLIYIILVALYLLFRLLQRERNVTSQEYLVNALTWLQEAIARGDARSITRARLYAAQVPPTDPYIARIRELIGALREDTLPQPTSRLGRVPRTLEHLYAHLIRQRWLPHAIIAFFAAQALVTMLVAVATTAFVTGFARPSEILGHPAVAVRHIHLLFATASALLVVGGSVAMFRSRLVAYRLFKLAMLISVFLTQVFEFYDIQFAALYGLAFNVVGLVLVNGLLTEERQSRHVTASHASPAAGVPAPAAEFHGGG